LALLRIVLVHEFGVRLGHVPGDRRAATAAPTHGGARRLSRVRSSGPADCTREGSPPQLRNLYPFGCCEMVCHVRLVETGNGLVLIDTGFGPKDCDDPTRRVG